MRKTFNVYDDSKTDKSSVAKTLKETKTQHVLPGVEYHVSMNLIVASSAYAEASHESTLYDFKTANPNINLHIQIKYVPIH